MSKKSRVARQRANRAAAALRQAHQRRHQRLLAAGAALGTVLLLIIVMVIVKVSGGGEGTAEAQPPATEDVLSAEVLGALTGVPAGVFDRVGSGRVQSLPQPLSGQPALTSDSKPVIVYIGAEYCPFCASQRWGLVVALSRFGTFTGLKESRSAMDDTFPGTPTVSFHGSTYRSDYLVFDPVETHTNVRQGNGYGVLEQLSARDQQVLNTYNRAPYVPKESAGAIPFLDFANRYLMSGTSFSPEMLAGRSVADITGLLVNADEPITQAIVGSANAYTTILCELTGGAPAAVCGSAGATAYKGSFDAG